MIYFLLAKIADETEMLHNIELNFVQNRYIYINLLKDNYYNSYYT